MVVQLHVDVQELVVGGGELGAYEVVAEGGVLVCDESGGGYRVLKGCIVIQDDLLEKFELWWWEALVWVCSWFRWLVRLDEVKS